jgi:hypothetical protein
VFYILIRTATEGLEVEIAASPSSWGRLLSSGRQRGTAIYRDTEDNVSLEVEVLLGFTGSTRGSDRFRAPSLVEVLRNHIEVFSPVSDLL